MATPLGLNRKHPCPRTRWHAYRPQPISSTMASLYGVCLKGVDNLLNRTLPAAGTSGSTRQVWGLLEQDSVYGRLRRFINSLHDMYNKYISTNKITTQYTLPCHTGRKRPDETGNKLTPTQGRGFPGFLSGMHARHMRMITITSIFISNSKEITNMPSCKWSHRHIK